MRLASWCLVVFAACGARAPANGPANRSGPGGDVTLYRDAALVRQRVELDVPPASTARIRIKVAAGVDPDDLHILERDHFTVAEVHGTAPPRHVEVPDLELEVDPCAGDDEPPEDEGTAPALAAEPPEPTEIELVIGAPRAGPVVLHVGYVTDRISWAAGYTMTTTAARDQAVLRGAIAIRNATGIPLHGVSARVVDAELGRSTSGVSALLAHREDRAEPSTTRELGRVDLIEGETRLELLAATSPRKMRSVLVYDPIGTKLDRRGAAPARELQFGVSPPASRRVIESFEIARDVRANAGLPGGPVRLLERRPDGTLQLLGESRLFDASTRVAELDTVAVGTAHGVTGRRERREITIDDDRKRLVEEFVVTIDNARDHPVEILIREHLYRGQNWVIPYPLLGADAKEGPQQIVIRKRVPARGQVNVLYVVVYTGW